MNEQQLLQLLSPLQQQHFQHRLHHQQESHQLQQKPTQRQQQQQHQQQQQQQQTPFKLSYVDFPPRCAGAGSVICSPDYERFELVLPGFLVFGFSSTFLFR